MPVQQALTHDLPDYSPAPAGDLAAILTVTKLAGWPLDEHLHVHVHDPPVPDPRPEIPTPTPDLCVTRVQVGDAVVVHASGEVDLCTAPDLAAALRAGCLSAHPPGPLVVDLTGIRFFSAAGLTVLVATHQECRERHLTLRVVANQRSVLRPLHITGLDTLLTVTPSLLDATRPQPQ